MTDIRTILAKNLKELRIQKKLTQLELAQMAGFQDASYSRWETGKSWPEPETIAALARALNVSESRLFQDTQKSELSPREALVILNDFFDKLN